MLQQHSTGRPIRFHLKIDTGLHRSGVSAVEATDLLHGLQQFPALQREGLYTHFACADEPERDCTSAQLSLFLRTARELEAAGFAFPSNTRQTVLPHSAALIRTLIWSGRHQPVRLLSLVRDCSCRAAAACPQPALSDSTSAYHPAGAGVGYGYAFGAQRRTRIALAPVGYGDGLPRSLGNGRGRVLVHGTAAPIVGRVSMDQITVDVTDIGDVMAGDEIVLIGAQGASWQDAAQLAARADTISYDILTGLLPRPAPVCGRSATCCSGDRRPTDQ
jgi:alanine racemase